MKIKKHLFWIIPFILIFSFMALIATKNLNYVKTVAYNCFGSNNFIQISQNPVMYKTKKLDCVNRLIEFMKNKGYIYKGREESDFVFIDKSGEVGHRIRGVQVDYYTVYTFVT